MDRLETVPQALSIQQPWVDLILFGVKTIEVRGQPIPQRGPILIHASGNIDWKTAELLGYDNALGLPRGGLLGITEILDAFEFSRATWSEAMSQHRVIHPPIPKRIYGARLGQVIRFGRLIPCRGRPTFFLVPPPAHSLAVAELMRLGLLVR